MWDMTRQPRQLLASSLRALTLGLKVTCCMAFGTRGAETPQWDRRTKGSALLGVWPRPNKPVLPWTSVPLVMVRLRDRTTIPRVMVGWRDHQHLFASSTEFGVTRK